MNHDDYLYQDRTWFDQIAAQLLRCCRQCLPRQQGCLWSGGFAVFAALCVAWAAGLSVHVVLAELPWNQAMAQVLAVLLLLAAARHFLAATGLSAVAAQPRHKPIRRTVARRPVSGAAVPAIEAPTAASPAPASTPPASVQEDAQPFFRDVKAAGINVRIARALYAAGLRTAEQVRAADDRELLAMPGIGVATLRKLRVKFGLPRTTA